MTIIVIIIIIYYLINFILFGMYDNMHHFSNRTRL